MEHEQSPSIMSTDWHIYTWYWFQSSCIQVWFCINLSNLKNPIPIFDLPHLRLGETRKSLWCIRWGNIYEFNPKIFQDWRPCPVQGFIYRRLWFVTQKWLHTVLSNTEQQNDKWQTQTLQRSSPFTNHIILQLIFSYFLLDVEVHFSD